MLSVSRFGMSFPTSKERIVTNRELVISTCWGVVCAVILTWGLSLHGKLDRTQAACRAAIAALPPADKPSSGSAEDPARVLEEMLRRGERGPGRYPQGGYVLEWVSPRSTSWQQERIRELEDRLRSLREGKKP
jgi:hypothetical protein